VHNSVIVVVVVAAAVVVVAVVRNGWCYNYYLPQVMLCCFFWNNVSWEGKWENMLDVHEIKTVFCWKVGTQKIRFLGVQGMCAST